MADDETKDYSKKRDPASHAVLLWHYKVPVPRSLDFSKVIGRGEVLMRKVSEKRDYMIKALEDDNISCDKQIEAISNYLPFLWGMKVSIEKDPKIPLKEPLCFYWTPLFEQEDVTWNSSSTLKFETAMTLLSLAVCWKNKASSILDEQGSNKETVIKETNSCLRKALDIFNHILSNELPATLDNKELTASFLQALVDLTSAEMQMLTIKNGLLFVGTKRGMLAKLSMDCWKRVGGISTQEISDKGFVGYLNVQTALMKTSTYRFLGDSFYEEQEGGNATACLRKAAVVLGSFTQGKKSTSVPEELIEQLNYLSLSSKAYEKDTEEVYFQNVPSVDKDIDHLLCERVQLVKADKWTPPKEQFSTIK